MRQRCDTIGVEPVYPAVPLGFVNDEAALLENTQVLRDRWPPYRSWRASSPTECQN
jgi:hypothetical protein